MVFSTSEIYVLTSNSEISVIISVLCGSDLHTDCILNNLFLLPIEFHIHHQMYSGCSMKSLKPDFFYLSR